MVYSSKGLLRKSEVDRLQTAELARQKAVDDKHDSQFCALAISMILVVMWCGVLTFAVLQK